MWPSPPWVWINSPFPPSYVGHEPLPPTLGRNLFGRQVYQLPGLFAYAKHIIKIDGKSGLFKGLTPRLCAGTIGTIVHSKVLQKCQEEKIEVLGSSQKAEDGSLQHVVNETTKEMIARSCATIVTHPFHVITLRCMVQFIGREAKYSGLIPRLLGDVLSLWICNMLAHFINTYAIDDSFFASMLTYPFVLVSNLMAVNNCGLAGGLPPYAAIYPNWLHCWSHLSREGNMSRGNSLFFRKLPAGKTEGVKTVCVVEGDFQPHLHQNSGPVIDGIGEEVLKMSTEEIVQRTRLLDSEIKIMKSEVLRVTHELQAMKDKIKENTEKIKVNKTLPYLVSNVIELLDVDPNDQEEDGANIDLDSQRKGKCAVIKTSTRQTYFLPVIGLVDAEKLKPGDLVGVNKDSYLILETLPTEYDSRVKAMEVDERPTEQYSDIGGLDKQIQELVEAIVLPMNHKEKFENLGIQPPKGVLMYGPPGTGKTLLARACAAQTKATFLKLAGPQLVQMFIGDGAKLVRDAFALAKEKAPSIIFIDELDAIGTKRFDSEKAGDREVQRTMLELLNQLDGFQPNMQVKVIAATNRVDILDPALLRSGRLDRKIEFPMPNEEARARIMQIHSRKMNVPDVNYEELARCTDDFNGAQCKAVCVEAGMIALRRGATELNHEDYMEGILEVQAKKKANLQYYA
ncbi:26S proteasome regulatory subunit 6A [Labeo rohita]|uniref:26S proteasome regulatory subunit 6A n=1 Tax=Labeo rohita TaxID=84645 RepID=A0ABQ8MI62_LABRO|nr:26S proteasome regulatory subunit 6A [Labeo rohita]